jgi:hypothetical protein
MAATTSQQPDYGDEVRELPRKKGCEPYKENGQEQRDPEGTPIWEYRDNGRKFQVPDQVPSGSLANKILGEADIDEHFPEGKTVHDREAGQPTAP